MKKTTLLALSLIGPFAFLAPAHAASKEAAPAKAAPTADLNKADLAKLFNSKLVDAAGKPVKSDKLKKAKYVAVYFSASWCGPCRKFTPKLVEFANEHSKDDKVQFVFISAYHSQKEMLKYMTDDKMPWCGVLQSAGRLQYVADGLQGIPHLRVFDAEGNVVIDSVKDGKYIGPQYVLGELKKKL